MPAGPCEPPLETPLDEDPYLPRRFTPVPRASRRGDGWTVDRQYAFIDALTRLPSVAAAARSVGMRPGSAHRLRRAGGAADFALAWDEALEIGTQAARDRALERATIGVPVRLRRYGAVVGMDVRHNDGLLVAALNSMRAEVRRELPHQKRLDYAREKAEIEAIRGYPLDYDFAEENRIADAVQRVEERFARGLPAGPRVRAL